MDLNPVFTSLSSFSHSPNSPTHAPTLFNLSGVRLVHGWLADPQSRAYSVLERVKDYDAATTLIVGCDAVMGGQLVESVGGGGNEDGGEGEGGKERSAEERQMIEDGKYLHLNLGTPSNACFSAAFLVRDFLESNPTQLTYHGLESLFSNMHARELVCLFRNSHLGVLYKRVDEQGQESLWTLVTDANFANEGAIAWEVCIIVS